MGEKTFAKTLTRQLMQYVQNDPEFQQINHRIHKLDFKKSSYFTNKSGLVYSNAVHAAI